jgi:hypothetical protein
VRVKSIESRWDKGLLVNVSGYRGNMSDTGEMSRGKSVGYIRICSIAIIR